MAWLQQTRPDLGYTISTSARITKEMFSSHAIKAYNSAVLFLRRTKSICLRFPKLDANTLRLAVYVDAGHTNTDDSHCQIGILILLADASDRCSILFFSSKKSRRITRSTTAAESLAFAEGFDAAYAIRADLQRILNKVIPIIMLTDSEILFNVITRRRTTTEKRLMVDLHIARAAYAGREISNIALIPSCANPADALTKLHPNNALRNILLTSVIKHPISQYIIEPTTARRFI